MQPDAPLILVAHHRETCGGLLPGLLERAGMIRRVHPFDGEALPPHDQVRGAIIMGSRHCVHEKIEGLAQERAWLEDLLGENKPVLGICFGAQLIGLAAGATVKRGEFAERGPGEIQPAKGQHLLMTPMRVMQWHEDGVFDLPSTCQRIATGGTIYPEQAFRFGSAIGLQFHPEATADMLARWLARDPHLFPTSFERDILFQRLSEMDQTRQWLAALVDYLFCGQVGRPRNF